MRKTKGIDVSEHNGVIDWKTVSENVDFVIIRAGYGKGHEDEKFRDNAKGCEKYGIPYGAYWFSYATTIEEAEKEAEYCINLLNQFAPTYPICFDYEYDSYEWAVSHTKNISYDDIANMAKTFLRKVEQAGYYAMIYTNNDWLNRCFYKLTSTFDTWLADWGTNKPNRKYGIRQYSSVGRIAGIQGNVDLNSTEYNYPVIIKNMKIRKEVAKNVFKASEALKIKVLNNLPETWWNTYLEGVNMYLNDKYTSLDDMRNEGWDSDVVDAFIKALMDGD